LSIAAGDPVHISLTIGTGHVNVGSNPSHQLEQNIFQALKHACPHPQDQGCGPNVKGEFAVEVGEVNKNKKGETYVKKANLQVTVDAAQWHGNTDIYHLLLNATAGAVERGTWFPEHCYTFDALEKKGKKEYTFCSTTNRVAVSFPRNNYMNVSLSSPSNDGQFDCWKSANDMGHYMSELEPHVEKALGLENKAVSKHCSS
jgi:hypothetical protein